MTTYNLIDILPASLSNQFDFVATYDDANYTVFDTSFFVSEIYQNFSSRKINLADTDASERLIDLFNIWKRSRNENYGRRLYALSVDYEPLENYDRIEERQESGSITHGEKLTRQQNTSDNTTNNLTDISTRSGSVTNNIGIYGVNSATAVPSETNTETYNDVEDSARHTGTTSIDHTGTVTDTHSGTDSNASEYTLRAHGNIGVTTSAQMLEEDLNFLRYDVALIAVCEFIQRYTFIEEGLEL